jgi:hypothetical protein
MYLKIFSWVTWVTAYSCDTKYKIENSDLSRFMFICRYLACLDRVYIYFRNVQLDDEGSYFCRAANEGGVTEKAAYIRVQGVCWK